MHLILTGLMASGKSTLGRLLARDLSMPFVDADSVFRERFGLSAGQYIVRFGEEKFRRHEARLLRDILISSTQSVIATGGGAPLLARSRVLMKERGFVVWLDVPPNILLQRMHSGERPLSPKPISAKKIGEMLEGRLPFYRQAVLRVKNHDSAASRELITQAYLRSQR